jgi:DNA polymerase IV
MERIIFHVDVNNAFLSWTAVDLLEKGSKIDIRKMATAIAGDQAKRRGIILAKSPIAKAKGVSTAMPIYMAKKYCPNLTIYAPNHELYKKESDKFYAHLCAYSKYVERFSIDECYLDMTYHNLSREEYGQLAYKIKDEIRDNFGFTVNIGIGNNKLCAKMASDFLKPDKVHTLFKEEVEQKLWGLPVEELYMIGKKSASKLHMLNINTIGDLAKANLNFLQRHFKNSAIYMNEYAHGIDNTKVNDLKDRNKNISISTTLPVDMVDKDELKDVLADLSDKVTLRLKEQKVYTKTIAITLRNNEFHDYQHQTKLYNATNSNADIYKTVCLLLDKLYKGEPIRHVGIRLTDLTEYSETQLSLFEEDNNDNQLNKVIENINLRCKNKKIRIMPASQLEKK